MWFKKNSSITAIRNFYHFELFLLLVPRDFLVKKGFLDSHCIRRIVHSLILRSKYVVTKVIHWVFSFDTDHSLWLSSSSWVTLPSSLLPHIQKHYSDTPWNFFLISIVQLLIFKWHVDFFNSLGWFFPKVCSSRDIFSSSPQISIAVLNNFSW